MLLEKQLGLSLLVVDDDSVARRVLRFLFENMGYQVDEAEHGSVAIAKFIASDYAVVTLDYHMPDMDGACVAKTLRQHEKISEKTLIVGITAHVDSALQSICMQAGMHTVLRKPMEVSAFKQCLKTWHLAKSQG